MVSPFDLYFVVVVFFFHFSFFLLKHLPSYKVLLTRMLSALVKNVLIYFSEENSREGNIGQQIALSSLLFARG